MLAGGCGSDEPRAEPEETVVAALGDSITAGNPGFDPDPAERDRLGFGDDERSQFEYWAERADDDLDLRNCGVFGERTDQIALRLEDCAADADALVVQGGINDIAQGRPVREAAANLERMVEAGQERGLEVAIADVLPWNDGFPRQDPPIRRLNRLIERIGTERDVPVLGFHDELEDPARPGLMRQDLTADGDHPSVEGYRLLGELVAEELGANVQAGT